MAVLQSIINNALPTSLFTYSKGTFVAEASDLKGRNVEQQIYDDACDVGFCLRSPTGNVVKFFLSKEHKDSEGDITHWEFLPCAEDVRKRPIFAKMKVVIFND